MLFLAFLLAIPAAHAAEVMRITFIRHGESTANAADVADTSVPGPVLTENGRKQARDIVKVLGDNNYDAIYASTMVRTQLTAAPMAEYLGLPIQVIPGLQEIEAGIYEGTPESDAINGYLQAPLKWLQGDLDARIPGSINGREFDARMDGAIQTMYDNGDRNVAAFSHGGAIMFWVFLNAENADPMWLMTNPLRNTGYVVVEGNPEDGWRVVNWNGTEVGPETPFRVEALRQVRTLSRQLNAAASQVADAFATRDPGTIATAINRSIADASFSVTKFNRAIGAEIIDRVSKAIPKNENESRDAVTSGIESVQRVGNVESVKAALDNTAGVTEPAEDAKPVKVAQGTATDTRAESDAKPTVTKLQPKLNTRSGATDLSDGNKAVPGLKKSVTDSRERVRAAVEDTRDQISSSVRNIKDAVKKATTKPSEKDAA